MIRARSQTGARLVGSTGKSRNAGGYLTSKVLVLKGHGGGVRRVCLVLDPLPAVGNFNAMEPSVDATTIPLQVAVRKSKADGP